MPFLREIELPVHQGHRLAAPYCADFTCHGQVIVALKALDRLGPVEQAQVII